MQTVLKDKYKIIKTIGSGGMGIVYLAENIKLGSKWAIKVIPKNKKVDFDLLAEPNILKNLNHPSLPRIIDIEEDDKNIYIIEDFIEGLPLDKQLQTRRFFGEETVIEWAKQLCRILHYLHKQKPHPIIYRDMKPSNIIVSADNQVKVIDFGIAREFKADRGSDTSYMGTRGYAAPEQYGRGQTDARTDIYSLGVTMYHLLTGKSPNEPPYELLPLRRVDRSFSEGISFIVQKCVQNNPAKRYQDTEQLLHDLNNIHLFNSYYKRQKNMENIKQTCRFAGLLLSLAVSLISAKAVIKERQNRYHKLMETGYQYLNILQFQDAKNYFDEAVRTEKKNPDPYLGIAQIFLKQGQYEECTNYLEEISGKLPGCKDTAAYNYLRGSVLYEQEDYAAALIFFEEAYEKEPLQTAYPRDLAVCYAKLGNLQRARAILDTIKTDSRADDILSYVRGQLLLVGGKEDEAIDDFEKVISSTENEDLKERAYMDLSSIYKERRGKDSKEPNALEKQIHILERAEKELLNKDNLVITEAMAEAYFAASKLDLSLQKFKKLIELGYKRDYIYRNIAIIYQQDGNLKEAEHILMTASEAYPDNYRFYMQLAYLYMDIEGGKPERDRDYSNVSKYYKLAVQFAPTGKNTVDMVQLSEKMEELKAKGWI